VGGREPGDGSLNYSLDSSLPGQRFIVA